MNYKEMTVLFPDALITQENINSFMVEKLNEKKRCVRIHISDNIIEVELCVFGIYSKLRYENLRNITFNNMAELREKSKSLFTFINLGLGHCPDLHPEGALFN